MWLEVVRACKRSAVARLRHSRGRQQCEVRIEPGTVFTTSCDARIISTSDGAALLDFSGGVCCNLNQVGAAIWQQIAASATGVTFEAILQHLEQTFLVSRQDIEEDIIAYLHRLQRQGIIQGSRGPEQGTRRWSESSS